MKICGYKITRHKPKAFYEIVKALLFLKENYLIDVDFDIYTVGYDDCLEIKRLLVASINTAKENNK